ncbi:hypothetical protein [Corynebacterium sp. NML130628]|uniref:hypothetical protein n=1 Tax=Corynebacterium sp. NML130628 TaxID=1906333 RepID=UPI0008FB0023|nr:hypothetical protein [Corynebacterium sp. NML130628]OIR42869.1 hypothetical protein BJP07_08200 [Corynebacterium sp. NML130628]
MFAAQADGGEPTSTEQGSALSQPAPQESTGVKEEEAGVDKPPEAESDDDDNLDGRGSKRAVLKDLAEAARDEFRKSSGILDNLIFDTAVNLPLVAQR